MSVEPMRERVVRQIRMLRAMRRELETGLRRLLHGYAGGNPRHGQGVAYGLPRQFPTLPPGSEHQRGQPVRRFQQAQEEGRRLFAAVPELSRTVVRDERSGNVPDMQETWPRASCGFTSWLLVRTRALRRPTCVHWLGLVGGDLQIGTMMIRVAARVVEGVFLHELYDLQRALPAVDVG